MTKLIIALTFILTLNVMFFLVQTGMNDTAQEWTSGNTNQIFNYQGSMISQYDAGNNTLNEDIVSQLPQGDTGISPTTGNIFTDTFTSMRGWFLDIPGMRILVGIVNGFPNFIKSTSLPNEFTYAISYLWHTLTIFLIALLWLGKQ